MKSYIFAGLILAGFLVVTPAIGQAENISKDELKQCVRYYDLIKQKRGNVERLGSAIDDMNDTIQSIEYEMDGIERELSTTIGYRRNELIQQFNSLVQSKRKWVDLYNTAIAKRKKRIGQHNKYNNKFNDQCIGISASTADIDEVCRDGGGFCDGFE